MPDSQRIPKESLQRAIDPFYTKVKPAGNRVGVVPVLGNPFAFLPMLGGLGDLPDMFEEALRARR